MRETIVSLHYFSRMRRSISPHNIYGTQESAALSQREKMQKLWKRLMNEWNVTKVSRFSQQSCKCSLYLLKAEKESCGWEEPFKGITIYQTMFSLIWGLTLASSALIHNPAARSHTPLHLCKPCTGFQELIRCKTLASKDNNGSASPNASEKDSVKFSDFQWQV